MNIVLKGYFLAFLAVLLLSGCAKAPSYQYHWGHYESLLYQMYVTPGEAEAAVQIDKLIQDIQEAESVGKKVPPGVYAHLGFMYASTGQRDKSLESFNRELALYPEAQIFIQGIKDRANKG